MPLHACRISHWFGQNFNAAKLQDARVHAHHGALPQGGNCIHMYANPGKPSNCLGAEHKCLP
eukprot:854497-Pelagomonas_calceolata.AAC.3